MAKRGGSSHSKRISSPKSIPIQNKKDSKWLLKAFPGPHSGDHGLALTVLLRDVLHVAKTAKEAKMILNSKGVLVDNKVRVKPAFPIGFMDVISFPKIKKYYRIVLDHKGRLATKEISKEESTVKLSKVVNKLSRNGKIFITTHDGKTFSTDQKLNVGDSVVFDITSSTCKEVLHAKEGAKCLITEGKHVGSIALLKSIIERKEGKRNEAQLTSPEGDFVTIVDYVFIINDSFKV
ncbi:MAG: 30S ribosomal protein S4e [Candidatus Micrarchaeota archaeon]